MPRSTSIVGFALVHPITSNSCSSRTGPVCAQDVVVRSARRAMAITSCLIKPAAAVGGSEVLGVVEDSSRIVLVLERRESFRVRRVVLPVRDVRRVCAVDVVHYAYRHEFQ